MGISMDLVKELKTKTGAGILDCKKTLEQTDGDMEAAIDILRKKGLAKADKKAGREAKEGKVVAYVSDDHKKGLIVKVNCETDFVGKTDEFQGFVNGVTKLIFDKNYEFTGELPEDVEQMRKEIIAQLGENILVSDWKFIEGSWLYPYEHMGKVASIINFEADKEIHNDEASQTFTKNIAMQVTALNPVSISVEDIPSAELQREKDIYMDEARQTGKPENVIEKIVEGKLKKYYEENVLMMQPFMFDEEKKKTIKDMIADFSKEKGSGVKIKSFIRMSL